VTGGATIRQETVDRRTIRRLQIVCVVWIINFFAFFIMALVIGGDAMNGKVENGHYLVASHGRLTEVSPDIFTYSLWHARIVFVTLPLAMIAGAWVGLLRRRQRAT
jgi:hypothetical protein